MTDYFHPLPGDLLLCRTDGYGKANLTGQKILRPFKTPKFTHVAVVVSSHILIHSTPQSGVDFIGLCEFFGQIGQGSHWKVYRHKDIELQYHNDMSKAIKSFSEICGYFLMEQYNFGIHLPEYTARNAPKRSFCSQLAKRIYDKAKIETGLGDKMASLVIPVDLQDVCENLSLWTDVTSHYRSYSDIEFVCLVSRIKDERSLCFNAHVHILKAAFDYLHMSKYARQLHIVSNIFNIASDEIYSAIQDNNKILGYQITIFHKFHTYMYDYFEFADSINPIKALSWLCHKLEKPASVYSDNKRVPTVSIMKIDDIREEIHHKMLMQHYENLMKRYSDVTMRLWSRNTETV